MSTRLRGSSLTPPSQETVRSAVQVAELKKLESTLAEFISLSDRVKERLGVGIEKALFYEVQDREVGQASKAVKKIDGQVVCPRKIRDLKPA